MEITIRSDVFGLSSTEHLCRNAVLHPDDDVVMMWWLCHLISLRDVGLNTSDLTQRSGLITRIASDLCQARQKYPCTVRSIIGLRQRHVPAKIHKFLCGFPESEKPSYLRRPQKNISEK
jgi:hypothetical protein